MQPIERFASQVDASHAAGGTPQRCPPSHPLSLGVPSRAASQAAAQPAECLLARRRACPARTPHSLVATHEDTTPLRAYT